MLVKSALVLVLGLLAIVTSRHVPKHASFRGINALEDDLLKSNEAASHLEQLDDNDFLLEDKSLEERGPKVCACQYAHQPYRQCRKKFPTLIGTSCKGLCKTMNSLLGPEHMVAVERNTALTKKQVQAHYKALDISCSKLVKKMSAHVRLKDYSDDKGTVSTLKSFFRGMDHAEHSLLLDVMPLNTLGAPIAEGGTSSIFLRNINGQPATVKVLKGRFCTEVVGDLRKDVNYLFDFIGEYDSNLKIQYKYMDEQTNLRTLLGATPSQPLINPIPTVFGYFLVTDEDQLGGNCRMPTMAMQKLSNTWLSFCTDEFEHEDPRSPFAIRNQCRLLNRQRIPDGQTLKAHFIDFLRAVYITHAAGVAHLDISPKNLMFDEATGRSYLIDLGNFFKTMGYGDTVHGPSCNPAWPTNRRRAVEANLDLRLVDLYAAGTMIEELIMGKEFIDVCPLLIEGTTIRNHHFEDIAASLKRRDTTNPLEVILAAIRFLEENDIEIPEDQFSNGEIFLDAQVGQALGREDSSTTESSDDEE